MKTYIQTIIALILPFMSFAQEKGLDQRIDEAFKPFSDAISSVIFFEIIGVPFVLILLVGSALFFTIYFGFVNIRRFPTAINVVRGKYDELDEGHGAQNSDLAIDGDIVDTIKDESQFQSIERFFESLPFDS